MPEDQASSNATPGGSQVHVVTQLLRPFAQEKVQLGIAVFALAEGTLPLFFLAYVAALHFPSNGFTHALLLLTADPTGQVQYLGYFSTLLTGALGTRLIGSLKVGTEIKPAGLGFIVYVGLCWVAGVVLALNLTTQHDYDQLNLAFPFHVDPEARVLAQLKTYSNWVTGSLITMAATLLALPTPDQQRSAAR